MEGISLNQFSGLRLGNKFILQMDLSGVGVGTVLIQRLNTLNFRKLHKKEKKYSAIN